MASSTVTNAKYLDYVGLGTLVNNIKTLVNNKITETKQAVGGRLNGGLATSGVQISLQTPSGFTVGGSDSIDLSTIEIPGATTTAAGVMTAADKVKLNSISSNAEVNQNAFSYVIANSVTLAAGSKTDKLTIIPGDNISITTSTANKSLTISNNYEYTHPEYSTSVTSTTSTLTSGSKFTALTGLEYHDDGHLETIISKEFTLPTLLNQIDFYANSTTTSSENFVNVVQEIIDDGAIAGQSTASIGYNLVVVPTQKYVDSQIADKIATADALIYKGPKTATTGNKIILETDAKCGYFYKAATSGYVCIAGTTSNGAHVEPGDMIIANKDNPSTLADWDIYERNIDGAVSGPASATADRIAVFNGTTGKLIKDGGKKITDLALASHGHNITANGNGDSEITVGKSNGELAVTYNISHATHMTTAFESDTTTGTVNAFGGSLTIKVPKLNINTYGHVTSATDCEYKISIPAKPTHPSLDLTTEWGTSADSTDVYDPNETTDRTWKIYKGLKSVTGGTNIGVTYPVTGEAIITCSYTYSLPTAKTNAIGGIKIYKDNTTRSVAARTSSLSGNVTSSNNTYYYGVEIDSADKAFVHVPWENDKVQSTTDTTNKIYILGSKDNTNVTTTVLKKANVYADTNAILYCAPSTTATSTEYAVMTQADVITTAMIDALFT